MVSQVWNYGRLAPKPVLENRSLRIGPLLIPLDDMRVVAREVKSRSMKLAVFPQANAEMTPEFERFWEEHPKEWYESYLPQFERFMLDVAAMAQEVGADMVVIPRVFVSPGYKATFDKKEGGMALRPSSGSV